MKETFKKSAVHSDSVNTRNKHHSDTPASKVPHFQKSTYFKKVKVKWSCYRPSVVLRVGKGTALLFHDCGTRSGCVVSSKPWPHFTPGKDPVLILQDAGWAPGPVWTVGKSRPHPDSIPDHTARLSVAIPTELPSPQSTYCGITIFNNLPCRSTSWMNEKAQFKAELWRNLNMHSFYSVDEFLMLKNDSILSSDVCMNLV